jgi:hypothetical protein
MFISLQYFETQELSDKLVLDLAENMARIIGYISDVQQFARLVQLRMALADIQPLMADTTNFIIQHTSRSGTGMLHFLVFSEFVTKIPSQQTPCMPCILHQLKTRLII